MNQPFIQLNGGDGGRGGPPHHQGSGPRPMQQPQMQHGFPPQGQAPRQMHQPAMQHGYPPPPPPREAIPVDLRSSRPVIEVTDIREQLMTESDMRRKLTHYKAVRFEKLAGQDLYDDDDGERAQSGWDRAIKTQVQGISRKDMLDLIYRLDMTTQDVTQKKASLSPALLRQLDFELDKLSREDDDPHNYVWTLAQIDQQLQEVDPYIAAQHDVATLRVHKTSRTSKHTSKSKKKSSNSSAPRKQQKVYWERVSLTAYFKRSPRQQANIRFLYQMTKRAQATTQFGGPQQPIVMNSQGIRPAADGPPNGQMPMRAPPHQFPNGAHGGPQQQPPVPPQHRHPGMRAGTQAPARPVPGTRGPMAGVVAVSDSDSDSSSDSDDESSDSEQSRSTMRTDPPSPMFVNKAARKRAQDPRRNPSQPRNFSRYYGVESQNRSRKRQGKTYIADAQRRRSPPMAHQPPPPPPPPPPTSILHQREASDDIERIKHAYETGRADERYIRQSPTRPPVITTYASDIERLRNSAYNAGMEDAKREDRFVEEIEIGARPSRVARVYQAPRPNVRTVDPRVHARDGLREQRLGGFPDDNLPRVDRLSMDDHGWEYHESLPRRPEVSRMGRPYGHDTLYESDGDDEDFISAPRGVEIHVGLERPSLRANYRTVDHLGRPLVSNAMDLGQDSHTNPFLPTLSPERGRSYERRR
ncbi:hypothetical protein PFICI_14539 [Pestalotiopsis fici W106-1]|uniref:Uncharacterized protein n=1 Tax=Pestalotiopsis fici (strain W106-1 / CGMCC3.15140) TaxID=1229662 RepID=W3WI77_PESFW|nr:uncharacterized protein PFICI_14539 [Pestalotiopsis fici W106-1]ETS73593.1 hypothetical protein PFICI_14539 [Pestalotiopsis fici W106-1]